MTEVESLKREIKRLKRSKAQSEEKALNAERVILSRNLALETYQNKLKSLVEERTRQLEEQAAIAEAASRAKSEFLARMSHEIRTPLNAIIGMSDLMRTDNFDDTQRRYFQDMTSMSHNLLAIINDILDLSKIEAGKLTLEPVHYDLRALFDHIVSMCRFLAEGKELIFRACLSPDLPRVVYGDDTRVRQILVNIINNAIKYTQEGFVNFSLRQETREADGGRFIIAEVRDSGRGIKPEDQERLFGKFEQFDREQNRGIVGTGLGLAITKQLLDMMGGSVTVESSYGEGSVFTARIPLEPGDPALVKSAAMDAAPVWALPGLRILVVDDMRMNLTVALGLLARHNIQAVTASSGEEALRKVAVLAEAGERYDLIFMDHMMPGMDGLETTRRYREWEKKVGKTGREETPIIAFSANAVQGARELFLSAGMSDFVSKPVQPAELNRVLRRWLPAEKVSAAKSASPPAAPGTAPATPGATPAVTPSPGASRGPASAAASPLLAALAPLCDIDVALEHLGNDPALKGVTDFLTLFNADITGYIETMTRARAEKDWKSYAITVHGFKGAFATMGNAALSEEARRLEAAAKEGRVEECEAGTEPFLEKLTRFREQLRAVLASLPEYFPAAGGAGGSREPAAGKRVVDAEFLREKLEALRGAARGGRSRELASVAAELDGVVPGDSFPVSGEAWETTWSDIRRLIAAFEYGAAADRVAGLL